jgi:prepilin signal peptidase PulO-like enzyme (type II secretory pathway)
MDGSMILLSVRLAIVFVLGAGLGSLVNWAIYSLAWRPRAVSPWSRLPWDSPPRRPLDRLPVFGWFGLWRESKLHGRGFWIRPLLLELALGAALAALYWWEIERLGLIQGQVEMLVGQIGVALVPPLGTLHWQFISHALLLCWMLAASFIDIDEKIIPDEITVTGTLLGLTLAVAVPMSLLPHVAARAAPPVVGQVIDGVAGGPLFGPGGAPLWLEPVTAMAPNLWPPAWGRPREWTSLAAALGCYWFWCFALAPRTWRGRRGAAFAIRLIGRRLRREFGRPPLGWLLLGGTAAIVCIWAAADGAWAGLLSALIGLVAGGGIVWAVRLVGTAALQREAMGFGDVTLMMMVGTFLGWQACLVAFFLSPFAALVIGLAQFIFRRDDVIPFGPFLCLASAGVVVAWAPIWTWAQPLFQQAAIVALVLSVCLVMLGAMLAVWRMIKTALFGGHTTITDGRKLYLTTEHTNTENETK